MNLLITDCVVYSNWTILGSSIQGSKWFSDFLHLLLYAELFQNQIVLIRILSSGWLDERAKNGTVIKVVSYNILAQSLLHAHPELYSECNKDYLTWSYRSFLLINELNRFNADVITEFVNFKFDS